MKNKKVVILGGGFGGFKVAKKLLKKGFEVLLISENDKFVFTPLLVEVSTSALKPEDISVRFDFCLKNKNLTFVLGKVNKIDFGKKIVVTGKDSYTYDYLVIAAGARKRELNISGVEYAFPFKNINHALKIKGALIGKVKSAQGKFRLNVIGAGPTGIEFVFAAEQMITALNKDIKLIINLFDNGPVLLPTWNKDIRKYIFRRIKKRKITFHPNCSIQAISENAIQSGKERFASDFTVLAVGVVPNTEMIDKKYLDEKNFLRVEETMQVKGRRNVFAMGDLVSFDKLIIPKLAQTAANQARFVAGNIVSLKQGKKFKKYHLLLKGRLLSIGGGHAIGTIKKIMVWGRLGNLLRSVYYIWKMPGLKNKTRLAQSWILHTLFGINLKK